MGIQRVLSVISRFKINAFVKAGKLFAPDEKEQTSKWEPKSKQKHKAKRANGSKILLKLPRLAFFTNFSYQKKINKCLMWKDLNSN